MLSAVYNPSVYSFQTYNPYEHLFLQQELHRRRQIEAQRLRRQIQLEQLERQRQYEYARQIAELQRRRQMEMESKNAYRCDRGVENPLEALLTSRTSRSPCVHRRSASPAKPDTTADAKQRRGEENATSSDESIAPIPALTPPTLASESSTNSGEPPAEVGVVATPNSSETSTSHATIANIMSAFVTLQSDFTFPSQLDFIAGSSSPKLAYTSTNAPVHQYEHQLTGLLTRLDAVESYGDEAVRKARKEAVKMIERELEDLDEKKAEAWRSSRSEVATEKIEDSAPIEEAIEMAVSEADYEAESKAVEMLAEGDEAQHETVDSPSASLSQGAADEQTEESTSDSPTASTSLPVDPTPVTPHPTTPSSLSVPGVSESLVDTTYSPPAILPQLPAPAPIPATTTLPSTGTDEPHHTSLGESSGSETSESELDGFVEVDTDMDAETMSSVSLEEVEEERDLATMDEWELDF